MHLLGATVVPVESGRRTLKDALNEALRDWVTNVENTFYIIGTVAGPHPYPTMVRDFQRVIGDECLRADARDDRPPARCGDRLRRRRQQRDGLVLSVHRARAGAPDRRRGGGAGPGERQARGVAVAPARPACCTATAPTCCRTPTARSPRRTRSRRGSTIPASAPSTRYLKDIGRAEYVGITDDAGARSVPPPVPHRRHHPGARVEPRGRARDASSRRRCAPTSTCSSTCRAAATRTSAPSPTCRAPTSIAGLVPRPERQAMSRIAATFEVLESAAAQGADPVRHRRRPVRRRDGRLAARRWPRPAPT